MTTPTAMTVAMADLKDDSDDDNAHDRGRTMAMAIEMASALMVEMPG